MTIMILALCHYEHGSQDANIFKLGCDQMARRKRAGLTFAFTGDGDNAAPFYDLLQNVLDQRPKVDHIEFLVSHVKFFEEFSEIAGRICTAAGRQWSEYCNDLVHDINSSVEPIFLGKRKAAMDSLIETVDEVAAKIKKRRKTVRARFTFKVTPDDGQEPDEEWREFVEKSFHLYKTLTVREVAADMGTTFDKMRMIIKSEADYREAGWNVGSVRASSRRGKPPIGLKHAGRGTFKVDERQRDRVEMAFRAISTTTTLGGAKKVSGINVSVLKRLMSNRDMFVAAGWNVFAKPTEETRIDLTRHLSTVDATRKASRTTRFEETPFGLQWSNKRGTAMEPHPAEEATVKLIFRKRYSNQRLTGLVQELYNTGVRDRNGQKFTRSGLIDILADERYLNADMVGKAEFAYVQKIKGNP